METEDINKLKKRWQESGSFRDEQEYLIARVHVGQARFVYLDPDETWGNWGAIVIHSSTGVIYGNQCAGTGCQQRYIEGYLVPVAGQKYNPKDGIVDTIQLQDIFHEKDHCHWGWVGTELPDDRLKLLIKLVDEIPFWEHNGLEDTRKNHLKLDLNRVDEICEAWVPVQTSVGSGVLLFNNCD